MRLSRMLSCLVAVDNLAGRVFRIEATSEPNGDSNGVCVSQPGLLPLAALGPSEHGSSARIRPLAGPKVRGSTGHLPVGSHNKSMSSESRLECLWILITN